MYDVERYNAIYIPHIYGFMVRTRILLLNVSYFDYAATLPTSVPIWLFAIDFVAEHCMKNVLVIRNIPDIRDHW